MGTSPNNELRLTPGAAVRFQEQPHTIEEVVSLAEVRIRQADTNQSILVPIAQLQPLQRESPAKPDILSVPEELWRIAESRYSIIKPLLENPLKTKNDVQTEATRHGLGIATVYRWLSRYEATGLLTSLLPLGRADKRKARLTQQLTDFITESIEQEYLTSRKKPRREVFRKVAEYCRVNGLTPPHRSTIYRRIQALSEHTVVAKREGKKAAAKRFSPVQGTFPGADFPLAVVQIDHTPLDIMLVDDTHRAPIGRPYITLAVDVHSRMVTGFYISFDPPGALAVGMCLVHSFLPKEKWLAARNIEGQWPCWGLPVTVHADNACEFRGKMLQQACQEYGINMEWRPVARPNFGGHIERLLGTFSIEIHTLPGTTFSNPQERGAYDSEKHASLTLSELEAWLGTYIVGVYHQRAHSGINMPPLKKYQQGLLGDKHTPGRGLPSRIVNEERLKLDFMPPIFRTVQNYGVVIDEVTYYSDVLRSWINAPDPVNPARKRRFTFRRDPRDISVIWFYDPELVKYFPIPYRDNTLPPISLWEFREAQRTAKAAGKEHTDERIIFQTYKQMRELEEKAGKLTKAVRRAEQRRVEHDKIRITPMPDVQTTIQDETIFPDIQPFDDLREL